MAQNAPSQPVSGPRAGETTWLWLIKIVTGPLLLLVIVLHFTVNHTMGDLDGGLMSYQQIVDYYRNPLIPAIEIIFLITVVAHCLIGLRGIILDMNLRQVLNIVSLGAGSAGCRLGHLWNLAGVCDCITRRLTVW
jgi:succinate dehydrogenase / fumarate reductase membrane anchor subunit